MKFLKTIRAWWRGLFRKRRFNMLNATDNTEEWHMHLSPASILAGLVAFMLMLFILTLSLVAYSPILEFLPGYRTEADRSRESLVQNIIRLVLTGEITKVPTNLKIRYLRPACSSPDFFMHRIPDVSYLHRGSPIL